MFFINGLSIWAVNFCPHLSVCLFDLFPYRGLMLFLLFLFTVVMWNYFLWDIWFSHFFIIQFRNWLYLLMGLLVVEDGNLLSFTFFHSFWGVNFINYVLSSKLSTWCSGFYSNSPFFGLLRAILWDSLKLDTFLLFILGYSLSKTSEPS